MNSSMYSTCFISLLKRVKWQNHYRSNKMNPSSQFIFQIVRIFSMNRTPFSEPTNPISKILPKQYQSILNHTYFRNWISTGWSSYLRRMVIFHSHLILLFLVLLHVSQVEFNVYYKWIIWFGRIDFSNCLKNGMKTDSQFVCQSFVSCTSLRALFSQPNNVNPK